MTTKIEICPCACDGWCEQCAPINCFANNHGRTPYVPGACAFCNEKADARAPKLEGKMICWKCPEGLAWYKEVAARESARRMAAITKRLEGVDVLGV